MRLIISNWLFPYRKPVFIPWVILPTSTHELKVKAAISPPHHFNPVASFSSFHFVSKFSLESMQYSVPIVNSVSFSRETFHCRSQLASLLAAWLAVCLTRSHESVFFLPWGDVKVQQQKMSIVFQMHTMKKHGLLTLLATVLLAFKSGKIDIKTEPNQAY